MEKYDGYPGILKWSLAQTSKDAVAPEKPMSEEDRMFLQKAIEETMVDEVAVMKSYLVLLNEETVAEKETAEEREAALSEPGATEAMKMKALENIEIICENLDKAVDLHTIGGYNIVIRILTSDESGPLKCAAASLLATCVQNNPKAQQGALDCDLLDVLMTCLGESTSLDGQVLYKYLLCLSCLIRSYDPAFEAFRGKGGMKLLGSLLSADVTSMKLKRKVIFIISSFLASDDDARKLEMKTEVREMGLIPIIASFVGHEDLNTDETAIECLSDLCSKNADNVKECQNIDGLKARLQTKLEALQALEGEDKACAIEITVKVKVLLKRITVSSRGISIS